MPRTHSAAPNLRTLTLPSSCPDTSHVTVLRIPGKQKAEPSRPHLHSFFELFFVEEGDGWHCVGDRKIWAKPGDLFLIAPGKIHDPSGLNGATKWIIAFAADAINLVRNDSEVFLMLPKELLLLSFLPTADIDTRHFHVVSEERLRWLTQLQQLQSELSNNPFGFTEAARALLTLLLIEAAKMAGSYVHSHVQKCSVQSRPLLPKVFRFIEANYRNAIGLQEVAKEVNLSPAYLTDFVRRETGRTVLNWIIERRMVEARHLLLETDLSVNQIAETVGYFNTGHFIRLFRRINGTTPQVWRLLH